MLIRIRLFTLMQIRIWLFTLMQIRIRLFALMRIQIYTLKTKVHSLQKELTLAHILHPCCGSGSYFSFIADLAFHYDADPDSVFEHTNWCEQYIHIVVADFHLLQYMGANLILIHVYYS